MHHRFERYSEIIAAILRITHRLEGSIEQFKAELQLVDGSRLHFNEVYIRVELSKYAYYRLTPSEEVLQGWDNAPHHPEIASFPHHVHRGGIVDASDIRCLEDVLTALTRFLMD